MSQTEKPFTVSDRRHFTAEGRPREDAAEAPAPEKPTPESGGTGRRTEAGRPPVPGGPADFSQFVVGLAAQAGALLSAEKLPDGVDAGEALEGARSVIAILEMLKEKTAGRLSGAEEALLDELLFQLRMGYVARTRTGDA
jgi:hypothetical protein